MNIPSQADFTQLAKPFIHYSRSYSDKIKSTLLTKDDLKKLFHILAKKANEAANQELQSTPTFPENIKEVFKNFKDKLWVEIWGENNEYINGDHESIFNDTRLPKRILQIRFNSYQGYQIATQNKLHNWFELQFNFKKCKIWDFSKITDSANQNNSYYTVQGNDETWVDGVYQAINSFLKDKALKRNWLYSNYTYDLLLYLIFFPIVFRTVYKLGSFLNINDLIMPLTVAIYIYIFIISLYAFRTIFNYAKWIFPFVEQKNGSSFIHRGILIAIVLGIIGSASYDVIKEIGRLLL